jgi:hypothetical protein
MPIARPNRVLATHSVLLAGLALAACAGVVSKHPLSTEETSLVDESMLGTWELDPSIHKDEADRFHIYIGRAEESDRAMEVVAVEVDRGDGRIKIHRARLLSTTLGEARYVSLRWTDLRTRKTEDEWGFALYEREGAGTLRLFALDDRIVGEDVRAGKVPGQVVGSVIQVVLLTADTPRLREYVSSRGREIVSTKNPKVYRKVR